MTADHSRDRDLSQDIIVTGTIIRAFDVCDLILSLAESQPELTSSSKPYADCPPVLSPTQQSMASGPSATNGSQTTQAHSGLKLALMLKQLELNLTQAKMCLTYLAPSTSPPLSKNLVDKSSSLMARINTAVGSFCA
jgi:hypothetical protein